MNCNECGADGVAQDETCPVCFSNPQPDPTWADHGFSGIELSNPEERVAIERLVTGLDITEV